MPWYRRSSAGRRQGTRSGGERRRRRRRSSVSTRAKYERPSSRNQRSQIMSLARMASRNSKILNDSKVYCDWFQQNSTTYGGTSSIGIPLTDIVAWQPGARSNNVVPREQTSYIREMLFNYYVAAPATNNPLYLSMFLVTIRPTATNLPIPSPLVVNQDYTTQGSRNSIILNSSKYRTLWTRFFVLYPANQTPLNPGDEPLPWGNPFTIYRRGRVTLKLNWTARGVGADTWKDLGINSLSPSKRVYLILASFSEDPGATGYTISWGTKFTSINDN